MKTQYQDYYDAFIAEGGKRVQTGGGIILQFYPYTGGTNKRNPSKHSDEERGKCCNWLKHNRKVYNAGEMKGERVGEFKKLLELMEAYKHKNQYE